MFGGTLESRDGKRFETSAVNDSEKASNDNRRSQKTCSTDWKGSRNVNRRGEKKANLSHTTWHLLYGVGFDRVRIEIKTKEKKRRTWVFCKRKRGMSSTLVGSFRWPCFILFRPAVHFAVRTPTRWCAPPLPFILYICYLPMIDSLSFFFLPLLFTSSSACLHFSPLVLPYYLDKNLHFGQLGCRPPKDDPIELT